MFTFKPAAKNGSNGKTRATASAGGNGHQNGNGHYNGNGHHNGNGPSEPAGSSQENAAPSGDDSTPAAPNGKAKPGQGIAAWLGLGGARMGGGQAAERPAPARHTNGHSKKIDSVIGPGLSLRGTLTGAGGVRIEGAFDGTIDVQGPVLIADGAKVTAEIRAGAVSVGGSLKGNITAGKVEILSTGRVWGDLLTTAFATEEGAFLRGQVRMEDELPAARSQPAPQAEPEREAAPV